jgi:uncharacterized protein YjbI with pentapeptide repeats
MQALQGIVARRAEASFSLVTGADNSFSSAGIDRADFIGTNLSQARLSGLSHAQMVDRFFNTSLFVSNAVGTFGNSEGISCGDRVPSIRTSA